MSKHRLTPLPKIKPLDPDKPLAPYSVPSPPPGKFQAVPGQAAMDFGSDDPDALIEAEADCTP
jgi:hypothetical protein